jgi:hypothetical protein
MNIGMRYERLSTAYRFLLRMMLATVWIVVGVVWGIHPDHLWQAMIVTLLAGLFLLSWGLDTLAVRTWKRWRLPVLAFALTVFAQYGLPT